MAILRVKDENGNIIEIPAIKGDKGDKGDSADVQINGVSIVENNVANIPVLGEGEHNVGLVKLYEPDVMSNGGLLHWATSGPRKGCLTVNTATEQSVDKRWNNPIGANYLDYAVKAAMTDGKGAVWTSEEKVSARDRLGLEWTLIDTMEVADVAKVEITFPQEYNEFMVIADISGNGTSVVYPFGGYFNKDEPNHLKGYTLPFTDFYPSTNDEHYELVFEKMNIENDIFLKVSGFESKDYIKKMKQNIQSTGWLQHYNVTNEHQCHCWYGVSFQRTITNATFKIYAR